MSDVAEPERIESAGFELDALSWADGNLTVAGRWTGVQDKAFEQPALLSAEGDRLLASPGDEPWAAEDGAEWHAVFPCERPPAPGTVFTLVAGADLELELLVPGAEPADGGRFRRAEAAPEPEAEAEVSETRRELASAQARIELMRAELESAQQRIDAAREERMVLAMARERAEADLRRVTGEREAAILERDEARQERNDMRRERDASAKERDASAKARDAAIKQRDNMERDRDKHRETARREKEQRKGREAELKALRAEMKAAAQAQPAAVAGPDLPPPPQTLPARPVARRQATPAGPDARTQRMIAAAALAAVFLLFVLLMLL